MNFLFFFKILLLFTYLLIGQETQDLLTKAKSYISKENYNKAIVELNKLIGQNPDSGEAYYLRGEVKKILKNYDEAFNDFNSATKLDYSSPELYNSRGEIHRIHEDYTNALADFDKALEIDPLFQDALINRAVSYIQLGNYSLAEKDLKIVLGSDTQNYTVLKNLGEIKLKRENYKEAISYLNKAIKINPDLPGAYILRGDAKRNLNLENESCTDYKRARDLGDKNGTDRFNEFCK